MSTALETTPDRATLLASITESVRAAGYIATVRTTRRGEAVALRVRRRDVPGFTLTFTVEETDRGWWVRQLGATGSPVRGALAVPATHPPTVLVWVRARMHGNPGR